MDMDDEHSTSDDHGIFSALTANQDTDELLDKSIESTTAEGHAIVEIEAALNETDEPEEEVDADENVRQNDELQLPAQVEELSFSFIEYEEEEHPHDEADEHGIDVMPVHADADDDDDAKPGEEDDHAAAVEASRSNSNASKTTTVTYTMDLNESDLARRQLHMLDTNKRSKKIVEKSPSAANGQMHAKPKSDTPQIIKMEIIPPSSATAGSNQQLIKTMQNRLSQKLDQTNYVLQHKTKASKSEFSGSIEIPKDLIIAASDDDLDGSSFVISTVTDDDTDQNDVADADLLAILEGNDDNHDDAGDNYNVAVGTSPPKQAPAVLHRDTEMELAMKQMMNLPTKRKGRPKKKLDGASPVAAAATSVRQTKSNELVHSIVQDWSGSESDSSANAPVRIKKVTAPVKKGVKQQAAAEVPARRSRIIKKKVIWDPDAPETAISYASLVQPSAAPKPSPPPDNPPPRILNAAAASASRSPPLQAVKRSRALTGTPPAKRKVSEVDRLLSDEGAINMLNALKRESAEREELIGHRADADADPGHINEVTSTTAAAATTTATTTSSSPTSTAATIASAHAPTQQRSVRIKRPHADASTSAAAPAAAKPPSAAKRPKKASAATAAPSDANSWDYIYSHRGDDSMIIRRRSNSSYSSSASTSHRLSIDTPVQPSPVAPKMPSAKGKPTRAKENVSAGATAALASSASFEFAKPNARRSAVASDSNAESTTILMDIRSKSTAAAAAGSSAHETRRSKRGGTTTTTSDDSVAAAASGTEQQLNAKERKIVAKLSATGVVTTVVKNDKSSPPAKAATAARQHHRQFQEIDVIRNTGSAAAADVADGAVRIVLQPFSGRMENVFTVQMMREVCKALHQLADEAACKVVMFTSATSTFCNGLDYATLLQPTAEKRRLAAQDLAAEVR